MGGNEPFLGPLALFGGIGLATGVLLTAGVTMFVFRDLSGTEIASSPPTARPVGITLLREFGGPVGTPTPQLGVAAPTNETRTPLGSALASLSEQEAAQRPPTEAQPLPAEPAQVAARSVPAAPAPVSQLAPYSVPSTYFEPPAPPRPTDPPRPATTEAARPIPTGQEEAQGVAELGPISPPPAQRTATATRPTPPPVVIPPTATRSIPPVIAQPSPTPANAGSGGSTGGSAPITLVVTTPTRTTR